MSDMYLRPEHCPAHEPLQQAVIEARDASRDVLIEVKKLKALLFVDENTGRIGLLPQMDTIRFKVDDHLADHMKKKDFALSAWLQIVLLVLAPIISYISGFVAGERSQRQPAEQKPRVVNTQPTVTNP